MGSINVNGLLDWLARTAFVGNNVTHVFFKLNFFIYFISQLQFPLPAVLLFSPPASRLCPPSIPLLFLVPNGHPSF